MRRLIERRSTFVVALTLTLALFAAACSEKDNDGITLGNAAEGEQAAALPVSDGEAGIADVDGELRSLPLVDDNGTPVLGDTTSDPRSPATYADEKARGAMVTWADAVNRLGKLSWYVDAVNARKGKTGFDWNDIEKWSSHTDIDPRVIHVFNMDLSDQAARDAVRDLVGDAVDYMPVARHSCIVNTRGFGNEQVQDFVDCRQMVRVSLAPIVFDEKGEPVGLRQDAGIFVDCFNLWWIPRQVVKHGPPPKEVPPPVVTPPTGQPPRVVPPGCEDCVPPPPCEDCVPPPPKDPCKDVNRPDGVCPTDSEVPPAVRGPGTTPVGTDPGPARPPQDTPTGCTVECDEDDGFAPETPSTTVANQGQGSSGDGATNTTSPPTTQAPAPAPPTTESPTTNPPPPPG